MVDDGDRFFFQPCFSPVWDTAIARLRAGRGRRRPPRGALRNARRLAALKEVRRKGDWSREAAQHGALRLVFRIRQRVLSRHRRHRHGAAGARRTRRRRPAAQQALPRSAPSTGCSACNRATAAGRRSTWTTTGRFCSNVPFADHNAMLDPTCADITGPRARSAGRARPGPQPSGRAPRRRIPGPHPGSDGSWYGRWGVNYIYGTCFALRGLRAAGETTARPTSCAPASGCARSRTPTAAGARAAPATTTERFTRGRSTPSQTAWALLGLLAGGDNDSLQRAATASNTCSKPRTPTEPGTKIWPPEPASRGCSI